MLGKALQRAEVERLVGQARHAILAQRKQHQPEIRLAQRPGQVDPANRRPEHRTRWFDCQQCAFSN
jgi:hypothetical protein